MKKFISIFNELSKIIEFQKEKIYLITLSISLLTMLLSNTILIEDSIYSFANLLYFILKIVRYLTYLIFMILILLDLNSNKSNRLIVTILLICGILTTLFSRDFQYFSYLIIVVASINIDKNKIFKHYLFVQSLVLLTMLLLSSTGVVKNIIYDLGTRNRNFLGFSWTTTPAMLMTFITIIYFYLYYETVNFVEVVLFFAINLMMFQLTNSKFIFLLTSLFLLCILFVKKEEKIKNLILDNCFFKCIILLIPFVACMISILLQIFYNPNIKIMNTLNVILSNRMDLGHQAILKYGLTLFGKNIEWIGFSLDYNPVNDVYNYVDSSYMQIMLTYGVITIILVIIAYSLIMYKAINEKDIILVLIISFICVLSITEPRLINIIYNPFIIIISQFLNNREVKLK